MPLLKSLFWSCYSKLRCHRMYYELCIFSEIIWTEQLVPIMACFFHNYRILLQVTCSRAMLYHQTSLLSQNQVILCIMLKICFEISKSQFADSSYYISDDSDARLCLSAGIFLMVLISPFHCCIISVHNIDSNESFKKFWQIKLGFKKVIWYKSALLFTYLVRKFIL